MYEHGNVRVHVHMYEHEGGRERGRVRGRERGREHWGCRDRDQGHAWAWQAWLWWVDEARDLHEEGVSGATAACGAGRAIDGEMESQCGSWPGRDSTQGQLQALR